MNHAGLAGLLVLCLAACTGDVKPATREPLPPEQALASGARIGATLQDAVTSRTNKKGDTLHAIVSGNVNGPHGGVVIPAGSSATLTIRELEPGNDQANPEGRLLLVVSSVTVNGESYPVSADLEAVPSHLEARNTPTDEAKGKGRARRDVVVSAGTPIVFALTNSLKVSAK